jgi:uncharacterized protein (TIGR03086 family)
MADVCETVAAAGGIVLLERAISYTLGSIQVVRPDGLSRPTPCTEWDLGALLAHLDDSLGALFDAVDGGSVAARGEAPTPRWSDGNTPGGGHWTDLVTGVRARARDLMGACSSASRRVVSVGRFPLSTGVVTGTGAIEVAVHGWDVAQAYGWERPLPSALAEEMLALSPMFVAAMDRPGLFNPPVELLTPASPSDRLLAFLGRHPHP